MVEEFSSHPYDVLILGGGVAGLSVAVGVIQAGLRPLLLEVAKQPGGRARSYHDSGFDEVLDNGPHLLIGGYHATLRLLTTLGTARLLHDAAGVNYQFWSRDDGWYRLNCPDWPVPLNLMAGVWGFSPFLLRDRLAALLLGPALLKNRAILEQQTVTQWLHGHGQSGRLFEYLWAPLCLAALNEPAGSANAALFAEVLSQAFFHDSRAARPLLPTAPLSNLFAKPAQKYIEKNGGKILCGQRVVKIGKTADKVVAVTTDKWQFSNPAAVVSALPYGPLAKLLPQWASVVGFSNLSSAPIVSVHLLYDGFAALPAPLVGLPFESSQWLFQRGIFGQKHNPGKSRISGVLSGAYRESSWSRERLVGVVAEDIARLQPALPRSRLLAARVIKERRGTFSPWPQSSSLRPESVSPWKNLFVAGDWTKTNLPATLESAAVSGELAVQKVLAFLAAAR